MNYRNFRYFITYHQWNSKPEFIVATHKVINYKEVLNQNDKTKVRHFFPTGFCLPLKQLDVYMDNLVE